MALSEQQTAGGFAVDRSFRGEVTPVTQCATEDGAKQFAIETSAADRAGVFTVKDPDGQPLWSVAWGKATSWADHTDFLDQFTDL